MDGARSSIDYILGALRSCSVQVYGSCLYITEALDYIRGRGPGHECLKGPESPI